MSEYLEKMGKIRKFADVAKSIMSLLVQDVENSVNCAYKLGIRRRVMRMLKEYYDDKAWDEVLTNAGLEDDDMDAWLEDLSQSADYRK